jgi:hypothetical protein
MNIQNSLSLLPLACSAVLASVLGLGAANLAQAQPSQTTQHIAQHAYPQPAQSNPAFLSTRRSGAGIAEANLSGTADAQVCRVNDNAVLKKPPLALSQTAQKASSLASSTASSTASSPAAVNRLRVGTVVQFDARTRTVGEAMNSLLTPVRYRITTRTVDAAVSGAVMRRPLPVAAREAGLMTIEQALLLLVGQEHRIVVDHRARLVAIERIV